MNSKNIFQKAFFGRLFQLQWSGDGWQITKGNGEQYHHYISFSKVIEQPGKPGGQLIAKQIILFNYKLVWAAKRFQK